VVPQVSLYTTGEPQGVPDAGRGCCAAGLSSLPLLSRPPSWGPAGSGGVSYTNWGGFLYNTYPDVSCMYPACILKDTRIPNVS
jgi:hypothetical protein